jgi:hypothetical protein
LIILIFVIQIALLVYVFGFRTTADPGFVATPIPTLVRATLPASGAGFQEISFGEGECQVAALDLITAWAEAGSPENEPFPFDDSEGNNCQATFEEVQRAFAEPNLWYTGAPSCTTCHSANVEQASANLSLATFADIMAGSYRGEGAATGQNILGDAGAFENSRLFIAIHSGRMPPGRPASSPADGPLIRVGEALQDTDE